jgi:hypothetical protein
VTHNPHLPRERDDFTQVGAHCPVCGSEYRPGFDTCADDGAALVPGPAPEQGPWNAPTGREPAPQPTGPSVPAARGLAWEEAWLLAGRLQSEGIEASVYPPDYNSAYGQVIGVVGTFEVLVPTDRVDDARTVVEAVRADPDGPYADFERSDDDPSDAGS